ncbi:hypothetical protein [Arthrobacter sp. ISL-69]|uniref:hypothetical protein n=1 Tax=Arthrobacter sp. ISL-69 TaxID=2819113 RepID=UPI001BE8C2CB|nr:hypothetical protein [Arthrobacter sp. ISL-69]MBT2537265.1 hypothetical protein [Arthrobacter sp. ISL-69]
MSTVVVGKLPENTLGYYDHGTGLIHVDEDLDRRERHYTVVHERFHKLLKHGPCVTPGARIAREIKVESWTAVYMITFRALLDAYQSCSDVQALAAFLNVDSELVYARMMSLTALERVILDVCAVRCVGVNPTAIHPDGVLVA